jgi:hypothetical protein
MSSWTESTSIWRCTCTRRGGAGPRSRASRGGPASPTSERRGSRDQVREAARLVDLGEDLLDGLVGQAELLAELGGALAGLSVEAGERRVARIERAHLARLLDGRLEVAALVGAKRSAMPRDLPSRTRRMPPSPRWTEPSVAMVPIV